MRLLQSLLSKLGLVTIRAERHPITVFLLDDDTRRHKWFETRFKGDHLDIADNVADAQRMLSESSYDAIFLDHDLHPEHYNSESTDDERTGYEVALWLSSNPELQGASTIVVHTRNADGAMRMVEELRRTGRNADYVPFPLLAERIKHYYSAKTWAGEQYVGKAYLPVLLCLPRPVAVDFFFFTDWTCR